MSVPSVLFPLPDHVRAGPTFARDAGIGTVRVGGGTLFGDAFFDVFVDAFVDAFVGAGFVDPALYGACPVDPVDPVDPVAAVPVGPTDAVCGVEGADVVVDEPHPASDAALASPAAPSTILRVRARRRPVTTARTR